MTEVELHGTGLSPEEVQSLVERAVIGEGTELKKVSVSFVDEPGMAELNQRHRGKTGATDVLSYPFDDSFPHGNGGEVIVCQAVVGRLAAADGRDPRTALRETIIHGTLHLLGYTDDTDADAAEMDRRTRRILEAA